MRLGPLRKTCVQPAPKSRWVSFGLFAYEDQDQKQMQKQKPSFPAKAGPTGEGVSLTARIAISGTGFSREEASPGADRIAD
jgi:hypothetical protein